MRAMLMWEIEMFHAKPNGLMRATLAHRDAALAALPALPPRDAPGCVTGAVA